MHKEYILHQKCGDFAVVNEFFYAGFNLVIIITAQKY